MADFSHVKIGDEVYLNTTVNYSFRGGKTFSVVENVTKTTKTQFTTQSGRRFKKQGGGEIGYYGRASSFGVDETKEMNSFKARKIKINDCWNASLKINDLIRLPTEILLDAKITDDTINKASVELEKIYKSLTKTNTK